jgi:mRNA interferase MazF
MNQKFKNGEIFLANLNPGKGVEPTKTRPVLILQSKALLDIEHPSTIIIPLTTNLVEDCAPLRIRIKKQKKLERDSDLLIDQIRAIDNRRLIGTPLTKLSNTSMNIVYQALNQVIGYENFS